MGTHAKASCVTQISQLPRENINGVIFILNNDCTCILN